MRVLVVEDEEGIASALRQGLEDELYVVDTCADGEDGLWAARSGDHDLVILDLLLPRLGGVEVCRRLRAAGSRVPILMLTARDAVRDVVDGLDAGADDYLTKPFAFEELLARVRSLLRAARRRRSTALDVGGVVVDTVAREASVDGRRLELTAKEFQVLEVLALGAEQLVPRERLSSSLWPHDEEPDSNALEVHVGSLRRKIASAGGRATIRTVRGVGYRLERGPG